MSKSVYARDRLTFIAWGVGITCVAAQIALLATLGLPVTQDGFWHLNWVESFNHAMHAGVYPRWYAEAFGHAGAPTFLFYPPLFRGLSLPFGLFSDAASVQVRGAVALLLLLHAAGAASMLRSLPISTRAAAGLWVVALLNPYFLLNVWIRGAWPEAVAMAGLWWLATGLLWLLQNRSRRGLVACIAGFTIIFLAHAPTALLTMYVGAPVAAMLAASRQWRVLGALLAALVASLGLVAFHWAPALFDQSAIRLVTGERVVAGSWPLTHWEWTVGRPPFAWLWACLVVVVAVGWAGVRGTNAQSRLARLQLAIATCGLLLMMTQSEVLYRVLPQLARIQFPWRWFALATPAAICALAALAFAGTWQRRAACALAVLVLALALPMLRGIEFATQAQASLDALFRCERAGEDCRRFIAEGELADRFDDLAFAGQHPRHYGPWIEPDGRVWRYEVYDYMPREILVETWPRAPGSGIAMPPFLPTADGWQSSPPGAIHVLGSMREPARWVLDLDVRAPGELILEQLRFVGWELRLRAPGQDYVDVVTAPDEKYYRIALQAGSYRIQLRHVGTRASRGGEAISTATLAVLLVLIWRDRYLRRAGPRAKSLPVSRPPRREA